MAVRRGHAGKVDGNHNAIVDALRDHGICAQSIATVGGGCPDIIAGFRGVNVLLEAKMPGKAPNVNEKEWALRWAGQYAIVDSPEAAIDAVLRAAGMLQ